MDWAAIASRLSILIESPKGMFHGRVVEGHIDPRDYEDFARVSHGIMTERAKQFPWVVVVPYEIYGESNVKENRHHVVFNRPEIFGGGRVVVRFDERVTVVLEERLARALEGQSNRGGILNHAKKPQKAA